MMPLLLHVFLLPKGFLKDTVLVPPFFSGIMSIIQSDLPYWLIMKVGQGDKSIAT